MMEEIKSIYALSLQTEISKACGQAGSTPPQKAFTRSWWHLLLVKVVPVVLCPIQIAGLQQRFYSNVL